MAVYAGSIFSCFFIGDDVPVFHGDDAPGALGEGGVVGDHDDGLAGGGELLEQVGDEFAVFTVEVAGGFIGQQHGGLVGQGAGDGDALLLAAGEAVGAALELVAQAEALEQRGGAVHVFVFGKAREFHHGERDVFLGGEFF